VYIKVVQSPAFRHQIISISFSIIFILITIYTPHKALSPILKNHFSK